jgi:hypothetical protein
MYGIYSVRQRNFKKLNNLIILNLFRSGSGAKEMILIWVQNRIKDYPVGLTVSILYVHSIKSKNESTIKPQKNQ